MVGDRSGAITKPLRGDKIGIDVKRGLVEQAERERGDLTVDARDEKPNFAFFAMREDTAGEFSTRRLVVQMTHTTHLKVTRPVDVQHVWQYRLHVAWSA